MVSNVFEKPSKNKSLIKKVGKIKSQDYRIFIVKGSNIDIPFPCILTRVQMLRITKHDLKKNILILI